MHEQPEQPALHIVSGGQTGVDRAALDIALRHGLPIGGWCPKGRLAEDGPVSPAYPLKETPSSAYEERTRWNVRDSDGTLVLSWGAPEGGTAFTIACTRLEEKPCLVLDLLEEPQVETAAAWLKSHGIRVLNIAGPRGSTSPDLYPATMAFLDSLFAALARP